jgi:hypothetical protein
MSKISLELALELLMEVLHLSQEDLRKLCDASGFAPAARRRRPARRVAGQQPAAGEISEAKTVIFRFLIKNIDFLLKSTQLELRKNTQTVTQKVDTNAQTHT